MFGPWLTVAAILVVAASAGYTLYRVARPGITDSAWFWLFAFSATGLIGLLAVSPKYEDRQKRLEARYEGRQRAHEAAQRPTVPEVEDEQPPQVDDTQETSPVQYDYQDHLRVPLHFLASALGVAAVATGFMLVRSEHARQDDVIT
jgi:hypothetical protein